MKSLIFFGQCHERVHLSNSVATAKSVKDKRRGTERSGTDKDAKHKTVEFFFIIAFSQKSSTNCAKVIDVRFKKMLNRVAITIRGSK